jgi:MoaA/NifB/PqqE/SkfB family radical SAM enzyme
VIEWDNKFCSFNSNKWWSYINHYEAILSGRFLPPIEVSVDPVNDCQLKCYWCNSKKVTSRKVRMTDDHLMELVKFFNLWGAKAICFAGGGEPTLHNKLADAFRESELPTALITNGLFKDDEQMKVIAEKARWIGISVDASTKEFYNQYKGADRFDEVINNIKKLRIYGAREICFKFLVNNLNQYQIFDACRVAKFAGAHRIHIRPVAFKCYQNEEEKLDVEKINKQINDARGNFEDERFKVFGIVHKFDKNLHAAKPFKKCLATPIMPIFHANNEISICIDRKGDKSLVIGNHDPIEGIIDCWGSDKHKKVIDAIRVEDCPKCTILPGNEFIEHFMINDECDRFFT